MEEETSVLSALKYLGVEFKIIEKSENFNFNYNKIILPGVGAFGDAMHRIKLKNFYNVLCKIQ